MSSDVSRMPSKHKHIVIATIIGAIVVSIVVFFSIGSSDTTMMIQDDYIVRVDVIPAEDAEIIGLSTNPCYNESELITWLNTIEIQRIGSARAAVPLGNLYAIIYIELASGNHVVLLFGERSVVHIRNNIFEIVDSEEQTANLLSIITV